MTSFGKPARGWGGGRSCSPISTNPGSNPRPTPPRSLAHRARCLVVEPQPWKCYRQAATRLRRQGRPVPTWYDRLAAKPNDEKQMERWIEACLVGPVGGGGEAGAGVRFTCRELSDGAGAWKRKLLMFTRVEE